MYYLHLPLPFGVSLVFYQPFTDCRMAAAFSSELPHGFVSTKDDDVPPDAVVVPLNHRRKPMKTEQLRKYEEAAKQPLSIGDSVYVHSLLNRGRVVRLDNNFVTVYINGAEQVLKTEDVLRVPDVLD